jgi:hypothetical protein
MSTDRGLSADERPVKATKRNARVYHHPACGGRTEISGVHFAMLDNPFRSVRETYCCGCQQYVRVEDVEWADTGENVASYRRRIVAQTPWWLKIVRFVVGV